MIARSCFYSFICLFVNLFAFVPFRLVGLSAGWLVIWLVGRSVGRLVGWPVGRLFVGLFVSLFICSFDSLLVFFVFLAL